MEPQMQTPAQAPKLTPEKLKQLRDGGIGSSAIVKLYSNLNPDFKNKYESGKGKFNFSGQDGKPLSWDDAALNLEAYGDPRGISQQQQPATQKPEGGGILSAIGGGIGNSAHAIWDYATAPIDAAAGLAEAGIGKAAGALGAKGFEQSVVQGQDVKNLPDRAHKTAEILPLVGAAALSPAGAVGAGVGAAAGKAAGNLIDTTIDMATGQPQRRGTFSKVAGPIGEGLVNAIGAKAVDMTVDIPLVKKGLAKIGGVLTNVSDDVLQRAFSKPQVMKDALTEISQSKDAPFHSLQQQIGNTMKEKISDAGKAIQTAKEFIDKNNPGATFDVSSSVDDIKKALSANNLSLAMAPTKAGKKAVPSLLNTADGNITIAQGKAKPLAEGEVKKLQEYVSTIVNAKDYSIQDVLDLKKTYSRIYNELGTNDIGTTSHAQKILRNLRDTVDEKISASMPEDLSKAYKDFSRAIGAHEDFGAFLSDNKGKLELSDRGEQYLNTLWGNTKGQRREDIEGLGQFLGIDISGKMQSLKDAQELSSIFPKTGSRTLDILRSFLSKGAATAGATTGGAIAGIPGALLGGAGGLAMTAATSPAVVGRGAIKVGELAQNRIVKSLLKFQEKLAPAEKQALLGILNKAMNITGQNQ